MPKTKPTSAGFTAKDIAKADAVQRIRDAGADPLRDYGVRVGSTMHRVRILDINLPWTEIEFQNDMSTMDVDSAEIEELRSSDVGHIVG